MQRTLNLVILGLLVVVFAVPGSGTRSAPATAPRDSAFGVSSHIASRYPTFETLNVPIELLHQTGAGWAREDFQFARISPERGTYDWSWHDEVVDRLNAQGISVLGVLNAPTPGWATPHSGSQGSFAPDPQLFAEFAAAAAAHFKGRVNYWQIWNEPHDAQYWSPQPSESAYAELLKVTYPAIKVANPDAQVLSAGVVTPHPGVSFLQAIADNDAWDSFDIIAIHPYTRPGSPENGQVDTAGVGAVKALIGRLGSNKPIWATEFGWSTGGPDSTNEDDQANFLVRSAVMIRAAGVDKVLWYNFKDDSAQDMYGLVRLGSGNTDYTQLKPAFNAFKTLNEQLAKTTPVGEVIPGDQEVVWNFEEFGSWEGGTQVNDTFTQSRTQAHSGSFSGELRYTFPGVGNDYVAFISGSPIPIPGTPGRIGMWIYGDSSGHELKLWLRDSQGETLQFRLGVAEGPGWKFLSAPIEGPVELYNRTEGSGNLRLDFPVSLRAIVFDDAPDTRSGSGTIYLDDVTVMPGPTAFGRRFSKGSEEVVDVLWASNLAEVRIPTHSSQGRLVELWGEARMVNATGGQFTFDVGTNPVFLMHTPAPMPAPTQPQPQPEPEPPSGPQRCFDQTGFCIAGRIREYWEENGGLAVFGYPVGPQQSENVEGKQLQVQWFQRNRLELHPENARPYDVLLGRLSEERLLQLNRVWQEEPRAAEQQSGCLWFEQTGHNICDQAPGVGFKTYWEENGLRDPQLSSYDQSLSLFGMPITEPQMETNSSGDTVMTQWFERARFEWHPDNPDDFKVLLGLLGNEIVNE